MISSIAQWHQVNSFAALPPDFYSRVRPQPLSDPQLLHVNTDVAALLDLSPQALHDPLFLRVFSGQEPLPGSEPLAAVYSGHQFGVWAGQLGDGRAHLLAEVTTSTGNHELQLKGSGMTPYSRMADGRAVVRSSVREYLAGEAMAGLGIPTTRALSLVVSNDPVYRETVETAAIITRVAPSFVRFGSFEHWHKAPRQLQWLTDYVIHRFYPECLDTTAGLPGAGKAYIVNWLAQVVKRTAQLIAHWQTAGFCHGVMNTDNMSILGLTLDYGPYGFIDAFQADHVCNHSDTRGRYAWNAQPAVAQWNLHRLASVFTTLDIPVEALQEALSGFEAAFLETYRGSMARKLGLRAWQPGDDDLYDGWWGLLHEQAADFTLAFRRLAQVPEQPDTFLALFPDHEPVHDWLDGYLQRTAHDNLPAAERVERMNGANPLYVLRNHLAQNAIQAAEQGNVSEIDTLLRLLRNPFTETDGHSAYAEPPPAGSRPVAVSCSS